MVSGSQKSRYDSQISTNPILLRQLTVGLAQWLHFTVECSECCSGLFLRLGKLQSLRAHRQLPALSLSGTERESLRDPSVNYSCVFVGCHLSHVRRAGREGAAWLSEPLQCLVLGASEWKVRQ